MKIVFHYVIPKYSSVILFFQLFQTGDQSKKWVKHLKNYHKCNFISNVKSLWNKNNLLLEKRPEITNHQFFKQTTATALIDENWY